jgi:putative oxidoreductase
MNGMQMPIAYIGRVLISVLFLLTAANELTDWQSTEQFFLLQMNKWMTLYADQGGISHLIGEIHDFLPTVLLIALVLKILGSFFFIFNFFVRFGAFCLLAFLVPTTIIMHDFWHLNGIDKALELSMFLKNLSVIGGLMVVLALGKRGSSSSVFKAS